MTLANKPVPGYLNPTEFEQATVHVIYEPPLNPGTTIRVKRFDTSACTAAGDETVVIKGLASDWRERHDGSSEELPYAYGLWDIHEEPHISDISQLLEHCDREGIADPVAYLQTDSGKNWLTGGHRIGDLRKFCLDRGAFRSALIGGILVPVVYETIRTQTMPVLGWSLESAAQTSFKGSSQFRGHRGTARDKFGRLVTESPDVERRRWTTTLDVQVLAQLDRISAETGEHRNEIVERLILDQKMPRGGFNRAVNPEELSEVVLRLCKQHGRAWPWGMAGALAQTAGITAQAVAGRKRSVLKQLEMEGGKLKT